MPTEGTLDLVTDWYGEDGLLDNQYYGDYNDTNCSFTPYHDLCMDEDHLISQLQEYIIPSVVEWFLIVAHFVVFVVGLVGNALVCMAVYRNNSMRTVTNYFIFNLAVADFMVILFCLPPTVVWDTTETWFFGDILCKVILCIQTISVAVSVLTLTGISVERWYAICYPLKFKATTKRAKRVIFIIWIISLIVALPELIVLQTVPKTWEGRNKTTLYLTQCAPSWDDEYDVAYVVFRVMALFVIPLSFMSLAYYKIVRVLWSSANIPGSRETNHSCHNGSSYVHYNAQSVLTPALRQSGGHGITAVDHQLNQRRKAAKMLVAVVAVFALSYLPVHIFSIVALFDVDQSTLLGAIAMICHWLTYANSAVNPVIYNFMSEKFRKEFMKTFGSSSCCRRDNRRIPVRIRRRKPRRLSSGHLAVRACYSTNSATSHLPNTSTLNL